MIVVGRVQRIDYSSNVKTLHPAAVEFIEQLALVAEAEGLPRIAGRIAGLLVIAQEPMSFDDLVAQLQVSRGSVSTNTRILESRGVIRRVSRLGERRDLFEVPPDFPERFLEKQVERQRAVQRIFANARKRLPSSYARVKGELQRAEEFHGLLIESTEKTLSGWKRRKR
ncbi:MAG: transcriptional regulator [Thermoanaerobaculia bacterium]|nr:transcriptional regulator [Thermoanaerobaculia bacterium]